MSKNEKIKQEVLRDENFRMVKVWNDKNKYIGVRAIKDFKDLIEIAKTYDRYAYCN